MKDKKNKEALSNSWQCRAREGYSSRKFGMIVTGFILAMAFLLFNNVTADAATAKLESKSMDLGINAEGNIQVSNVGKGKVIYTSSNKKIATVNKKGVVKGIKKGKAKIKVEYTNKKKTKKLGQVKVNVKNAQLAMYGEVYKTSQPGYYKDSKDYVVALNYDIAYRNPDAAYECSSSDENMLSLAKDGRILDANGDGQVTITIKETYKKKTKNVGSFSVNVVSPKYNGDTEITVARGEFFYLDTSYATRSYACLCTDTKGQQGDINQNPELLEKTDGILQFVKDEDDDDYCGYIKANREGTGYFYLYMYDYEQKKYTDVFAEVTVHVIEVPEATEIKTEFDLEPDDFGYTAEDGYILRGNYYNYVALYQTPYNYTGDYTVTSSDPSVVSGFVVKNDLYYRSDGLVGTLYINAYRPGTAVIKVAANGAEKEYKITVKPREYYADNDEYTVQVVIPNFEGDFDKSLLTFQSSDSSIAEISDNYGYVYDGVLYLSPRFITKDKTGEVTLKALYNGQEIYSVDINIIK